MDGSGGDPKVAASRAAQVPALRARALRRATGFVPDAQQQQAIDRFERMHARIHLEKSVGDPERLIASLEALGLGDRPSDDAVRDRLRVWLEAASP